MARLITVEHARAGGRKTPLPKCERCKAQIVAGARYFWWANRIGRMSQRHVRCGEHRPRMSEMQTSEYKAGAYAAQEAIDDACTGDPDDMEALSEELNSQAEEVRNLASQLNDGADSIESGFGHETSQSEEMRERAQSLEEWADAMETAASEVDDQVKAIDSARDDHATHDEGKGDDYTDCECASDIEGFVSEAQDSATSAASECPE